MSFSVQVLHDNGTVETVAEGKTASVADSIRKHPSLYGLRVVVVPDFMRL